MEGGVEQFSERRSSPSAGGLNSTGGYVYVANVQGLEPGIYYYDPQHHQLHWRSQLATRLGDLISGQHFANDIPMGLFLTSRFDKLWWKYQHSRAYRMALIEIGHVAQTFQLAATARRMKTWLTGALNESLIEPLLKFENPNEQVIFFVGCGYSDGSTIPMHDRDNAGASCCNDPSLGALPAAGWRSSFAQHDLAVCGRWFGWQRCCGYRKWAAAELGAAVSERQFMWMAVACLHQGQ